VNFIKSKPGAVVVGEDGRPHVCGEDTVSREIYERGYDLVVLATGMQPSTVEGYTPPVALARDEYGFIVPDGVDDDGMFSAGVAGGPFDVSSSVQSATAAALRAIQVVRGPITAVAAE
jgi:quinone-modifying oxidoreductase subunit QmoA